MKKLAAALALVLPLAAAAQSFAGRPPGFGAELRTMDALRLRLPRLGRLDQAQGLDQAVVLPERPGQNQVAWYDFEWQYVDVPAPGGGKGQLRLYYYRKEAAQARRALPAIQSAFARLVDQFHYNPTKRIPYILYATQREFQAQNVFQVSESVLGVTSPEDLKMAVPYFGDHSKFVEVSTHEMVHQFQIQKLRDAAGDSYTSAMEFLPLWFIEGMAEYYSKGGIDSDTDLYLRDVVWNPDPQKAYEVLAFADDRVKGYIQTYKLGQARIAFIADTYGAEKIQSFLENAYLLGEGENRSAPSPARSFGALVRRVLNEPIEVVDQRWRAWMKRRYYPEYLKARQDLAQVREVRGLPYEPEDFTTSPDGTVAAVRGIDRSRGRARLFLVDLRNPKAAEEIAADSIPGTESLHPIEYSVAAVGSDVVVFSAQNGVGDRLYLVPYKHLNPEGRAPKVSAGKRRTLRVRAPDGGEFLQISDPALSPSGTELAFVGVAAGDGQQDVYVVSIKGGDARRLTHDPYSEKDLAWGADGISFASDATDHGRPNLFRIDPASGARTRLTTAASSDRHPSLLADGSILYASDAGGKLDLFLLKDGQTKQITDFTTGLVAPAVSPKGRGLYASTFYGGTFRLVEIPKVAWLESPPTRIGPAAGEVLEIPTADLPQEPTEYRALSLRNWKPEAGFVYGGGAGNAVAGRAAVLFSDMLRDHVLFVDVSVLGSFDYTEAVALYENRSGRIGWVYGGYHYVQTNLDRIDPNLSYLQRDFGVLGAMRYPLDRFQRVELELTLGAVQRYCLEDFNASVTGQILNPCGGVFTSTSAYPTTASWRDRNDGVNPTLSPTLRWGYDTIRYDYPSGPLAGHSLLVELGGGWLPWRQAVHGFAHVDAEQFFQLTRRTRFELRLAAGTSFSPDERSRIWERSWWLSSADNLRGFFPLDYSDLIGRNFYVANAELQVPLDAIVRLFIFDYIAGVVGVDFGGVFDRWNTRPGAVRDVQGGLARSDVGAWDARTLTGVLGVNVLFGPLLLRIHFGHPYDIGGLLTPAQREGDRWVTNVTLRYFFM